MFSKGDRKGRPYMVARFEIVPANVTFLSGGLQNQVFRQADPVRSFCLTSKIILP